jgi:hypothetical protein
MKESADTLKDITTPAWPSKLTGYPYKPAFWENKLTHRLEKIPGGIVIHSGEYGEGTAEWAWKPLAIYFPHFAWSQKNQMYYQTCDMHLRAPHAGNFNHWIGVEMPGPYNKERRKEVLFKTRVLIRDLMAVIPSMKQFAFHSWLNKKKRDPGIVEASLFEGLGLEAYRP